MHYFAFFKLGSHLQFYHAVTQIFIPFIFLQTQGWFEGAHSQLIFPILHCPIHEGIFELDQLPDLTHLAKTPKQSLSVWRQDNMTAQTGTQGGDNRVYKNIILHGHQRWNHGFISHETLNHLILSAHAVTSVFIPRSAAPQSSLVTSLHFKHWQFTLTFHFLSFKSSSVLKSIFFLIKRIFNFL